MRNFHTSEPSRHEYVETMLKQVNTERDPFSSTIARTHADIDFDLTLELDPAFDTLLYATRYTAYLAISNCDPTTVPKDRLVPIIELFSTVYTFENPTIKDLSTLLYPASAKEYKQLQKFWTLQFTEAEIALYLSEIFRILEEHKRNRSKLWN